MQERERLASVSENATKISVKRQEVLAKEAELTSVLTEKRSKLDALLQTRGKGMSKPKP